MHTPGIVRARHGSYGELLPPANRGRLTCACVRSASHLGVIKLQLRLVVVIVGQRGVRVVPGTGQGGRTDAAAWNRGHRQMGDASTDRAGCVRQRRRYCQTEEGYRQTERGVPSNRGKHRQTSKEVLSGMYAKGINRRTCDGCASTPYVMRVN